MSKEKEPDSIEAENKAASTDPKDESQSPGPEDTGQDAPQKTEEEIIAEAQDDAPAGEEPRIDDEPSGDETHSAETEVETAPEYPEEPAHFDEPEPASNIADADETAHESHGPSFASTALMILLLILFVIGITLWAGPKLAPHLPESVAKYLNPAVNGTKEEIAALKARLAEIEGKVAPIDGGAISDAQSSAAAAKAAADSVQQGIQAVSDGTSKELDKINSALAKADAKFADLNGRIGTVENSLEKKITDLTAELRSMSGAVDRNAAVGPANAQLQASLQALQTRVDHLASELDILPELVRRDEAAALATKTDLATVKSDLAAEISTVAADAEAAKKIGSDALNDAKNSVREAAIRGLTTTLTSRLNGGLSYDGVLTELESLSGVKAPDAVAANAATGVATLAKLKAGFPQAARKALAAERAASDGGGATARISAWLESQVSARPTKPVEGGSAGAILSRVDAALEAGDTATALKEAEALPDTSKEAMSDWLGQLRRKVGAEAAIGEYIAATGVQG
ncbi:hypothetical protein KHP62_16125 [Rhodobacteraceae bacterium NNCM2]|nr:hypothetical protein [Coraliihabitans acroporae]